jgi:acyl-CoA thioesterase FadM
MDVTTLSHLIEEGGVVRHSGGLRVKVHSFWAVPGENRLSYTTLIRLIECCREHHWDIDIKPLTDGIPLDSICKSITGEFIKPVPLESLMSITYRVTDVRSKGYSLDFYVQHETDGALHASVSMVSVFYDPNLGVSITPPQSVLDRLTDLLAQSRYMEPSLLRGASVQNG